ncbi:MAG: acyltransferase [Pedobacter sp.]|nr:MAG: acyltransferase [Pedobacter sp.]
MPTINRRYDIDWLRVVAIGLLLIYHIAIGFQPWGFMIGFIVNEETWEALWIPMTMLNVWRIPLLFFVSGMGVYFAVQNKNWKGVMMERAKRILLPFIFGALFIVPLHMYLMQYNYQFPLSYQPGPGHLWFLGNIFAYVLILLPLFLYLKRNEHGKVIARMKSWMSTPLGLLPIFIALVAEVIIVDPTPYEMYAMTLHGFVLGMIAFFSGFCLMLAGSDAWTMLKKWCWAFLLLAIAFYTWRLAQPYMMVPKYLMTIESLFWIFAIFGFGYKYLNHPGKALTYLSQAAYPVYILHMVFLYIGSLLIFPLGIIVWVKFILLLLFTGTGCMLIYELVIRRVKWLKVLFGLK